MATLLADNAYGTLGGALTTTDTTLNFTSGHGARFPTVTAPDVLYCCILNDNNILEEVIITAHTASADSCTITRAAGATTAKAWASGDRIEARLSKTALLSLNVASATTATNAGSAAVATNIAGGAAGAVVYQSATSTTAFVSGTASDVLMSQGTGAPIWTPRNSMNVGIASTATVALSIGNITVGTMFVGNSGTSTTTSDVYVEWLNYRIVQAGTMRCQFQLTCNSAGGNGFARIYKNGTAFGAERIDGDSNFTTYTEDLSFSSGETLQIFFKRDVATAAYVKDLMFGATTWITPPQPIPVGVR
jgi:hypothetical protein